MSTAWRKALHFTVNVQRNTTEVSTSGATKFVYATVLSRVACSIQAATGRLKQEDFGQDPARRHNVLFGAEMLGGLIQQNDVLVVVSGGEVGRKFKVVTTHEVVDPNAPHVECAVESWVPGGGD